MTPRLERDGTTARVRAPAKVNLWLRVLAREATGYHQLETLFCALELADALTIERGGAGVRLEVDGAELGPPEENLVHRAALAFYEAARLRPGVWIHLTKRIPAGAGLGGGSSDAAATLRALNALYDAPLAPDSLRRLGARLGSDVPFFLCDAPLALAWGRGERMLALPPPPPAPVLVVAPPFAIATAEAYRALDCAGAEPTTGDDASVYRPDCFATWRALADIAHNDFEAPTFRRFPELAAIRDSLAHAGAAPALLSGSGSALFGVFRDEATRDAAAAALAAGSRGLGLVATRTAARGPNPSAPDTLG